MSLPDKKLIFDICLIVFTFFGSVVSAQPKEYKLTGTLKMETGETFPYRIEFEEENGNIRGFSYTYPPPNETKSAIMGAVDAYEHKLSFKEMEIVTAHVVRTKAYMCLINASLVYDKSYKGVMLSGPVTNRQTDNIACTPGTVTFDNPEELQPLFEPRKQFDTFISMKKREPGEKRGGIKVAQVVQEPDPIPEQTSPDKITTGKGKMYYWETDSLVLEVWDGGNTDGDMITISYNGKEVLSKHRLNKVRKRIVLSVPAHSEHDLVIFADNEGADPPNTATLLLKDGSKRYNVVAYNKMKDSALITISRD